MVRPIMASMADPSQAVPVKKVCTIRTMPVTRGGEGVNNGKSSHSHNRQRVTTRTDTITVEFVRRRGEEEDE